MRHADDGEIVLLLQADKAHHELPGGNSLLRVVAGKGDVVQNEEEDTLFGSGLDGIENFQLQVLPGNQVRVDFGADEVVREDVDKARFRVGEAHLELLGAEFQVDVHDLEVAGDLLRNHHCEDGLARSRRSEQSGYLVLYD